MASSRSRGGRAFTCGRRLEGGAGHRASDAPPSSAGCAPGHEEIEVVALGTPSDLAIARFQGGPAQAAVREAMDAAIIDVLIGGGESAHRDCAIEGAEVRYHEMFSNPIAFLPGDPGRADPAAGRRPLVAPSLNSITSCGAAEMRPRPAGGSAPRLIHGARAASGEIRLRRCEGSAWRPSPRRRFHGQLARRRSRGRSGRSRSARRSRPGLTRLG